ncbi:L-isoleucine 3(1)-dioxygenase [Pantoea sp. CCBC3-3-1]|uniref:L-isoleucine 3(1)-dioxygenase n=1 Tax=Pantoea sp. CCBC3-3-1 TaxID=2490851 RepID=UPI0011BDEC9D|nr:L-isoleucine 3(1)-dioxygenase [Pantoea sp. CCBC3-3-1]
MTELVAVKPKQEAVTGSSKNNFGYIESTDGNINFSIVKNIILNGHHHGNVLYVIRNYAQSHVCKAVADNFNHVVTQDGGNRPDDGFVLTNQVGATQFSRNGEQYIREVNRVNQSVADLMAVADSDSTESLFLNSTLEAGFLERGIHFGPARFKNGYACFATFRRWLDNGVMSLMPHEDMAQVDFAREDDFEIAHTQTVTAYNICLEAAKGGGQLKIWNLIPDNECRARLGVTRTGYPYPPHLLENTESLAVQLNVGDLYFMNACHLHGVSSVSEGSRLTAGRFIGKLNDKKVVYWT